MNFDPFQSRRNYNEKCRWWSRDERDQYTSDELIMQRIPSGYFSAKEMNAETNSDVIIGGVFMYERTNVLIKSPDNLSGIKDKDLVEYQGEKWIVTRIQKSKARMQNTMFANDKNCSHFWYLELRK